MDRMFHHRVVDQHDAHALAVVEADRLGLGEADAVESPDVTFHVAGEVQFDRARRLARIRIGEGAFQVGIGQYAATVATQADAGIVECAARASSSACRLRDCPFSLAGCETMPAWRRDHASNGPSPNDPSRRVACLACSQPQLRPFMPAPQDLPCFRHPRHAPMAHVGHGQQRARHRAPARAPAVLVAATAWRGRIRCDPWPGRRSCRAVPPPA